MKRSSVLLLLLLAVLFPWAAGAQVVEIALDQIIHPVSAEYVLAGIDHAEQTKADAVLIILNTPGGLMTSMRKIVDRITSSRVPVIVYVAPTGSRAASAGFFILMAADLAVMAPGTTTGAASPVAMGGAEIPETMKKKITNDAAAYLRSYTSKRGRNPELAELAVTEAKSFTDEEALKEGLIDAVVESRQQIFERFHQQTIQRFDGSEHTLELASGEVEPWEMTGRQRFLSRLLTPTSLFCCWCLASWGCTLNSPSPVLLSLGWSEEFA